MHLPEVISTNIPAVKSALTLLRRSTELPPTPLSELVEEVLDGHDQVELTKGMFLAVRILFRTMRKEFDYPALREFLLSQVEKEKRSGIDVSIDYKVIDILDALDGNGGSFYLQIHNLKEPTLVIINLIHVFKKACVMYFESINSPMESDTAIWNALPTVNAYVDSISLDITEHDREQAAFVELMNAKPAPVKEALHLVELLAPHWKVDITESGERVYHMDYESATLDEIHDAVIGTRDHEEQIQLLLGVSLITCLFMSMYLAAKSVVDVVEQRRWEVDSEINLNQEDDDLVMESLALGIVDCMARFDAESFYDQAYVLDDLYGALMVLNGSLVRTAKSTRMMKPEDIVTALRTRLEQ